MPRTAEGHIVVVSIDGVDKDGKPVLSLTGDPTALVGYSVGIRPIALSVSSVPVLVGKVAKDKLELGKDKDGKDIAPPSELAISKGKFKSAQSAVAGLALLDSDDRADAIAFLKVKSSEKYNALTAWLVSVTKGKLTADLIEP